MKALILTAPERMEIREVPVPEPGPEECLIRVTATGLCGSDVHIYAGHHPTAILPLVQGHEFAGVIERVRSDSRPELRTGDRVVAWPILYCGECGACRRGHRHVCRRLRVLGVHADGAFAEFIRVPAASVIPLPAALPDSLAVLVEPFAVGVHVLNRMGLSAGDRLLIAGGGPIGLIIGLVARWRGAAEVVFSEINAARLSGLRARGFGTVDPSQGDPLPELLAKTGGEGFDLTCEASGAPAGLKLAVQACRVRGTVGLVGFTAAPPPFDVVQCILKELHLVASRVYTFEEYRDTPAMLVEMAAAGLLDGLLGEHIPLTAVERSLQAMRDGRADRKIVLTP
jgi:2-desacetyl-2-hydroxyethyl bacteriochlorophyllide A dehydrogenase